MKRGFNYLDTAKQRHEQKFNEAKNKFTACPSDEIDLHSRHVNAPRAKVYRALLDPDAITK